MLSIVLSTLQAFLVEHVLAADPPSIICDGLPGCGRQATENIIFGFTIPFAAGVLLNLAGGLAVIFIVIGGAQMLLSFGDEAKITKARMSLIYAGLGLALALTAQTIVAFVATENFLAGGGNELLFEGLLPNVIRIILLFLNVCFLLIIMSAGFRMVIASGKQDEFKKSLGVIRWAIIGAIVINAARMLVQAVLNLPL